MGCVIVASLLVFSSDRSLPSCPTPPHLRPHLPFPTQPGTVISISRQTSKLVAGAQEMIIVYSKDEEAEEALRHLDGGVLFGSPLYVLPADHFSS